MTPSDITSQPRWPRLFAVLTLLAVLVLLLGAPLTKAGLLPWQAGLGSFAIAAMVAGVGALVLLIAVLRRRGSGLVRFALVAGLIGFGVPAYVVATSRGAPPIHDITTDITDPPAFVAITPELRGPGSNPVGYDPKVSEQQLAAYPQVRPMTLAQPPEAAFARAEAAARAMGWEIVAADTVALRIEATDTSRWWGFKDDVVIRLTPVAEGTRVDVRSKSRVGLGDLGANAKRITRYLETLARG